MGRGWLLLLPGSGLHSCCLSSPPQTGQALGCTFPWQGILSHPVSLEGSPSFLSRGTLEWPTSSVATDPLALLHALLEPLDLPRPSLLSASQSPAAWLWIGSLSSEQKWTQPWLLAHRGWGTGGGSRES